jgi:hypothetical protein
LTIFKNNFTFIKEDEKAPKTGFSPKTKISRVFPEEIVLSDQMVVTNPEPGDKITGERPWDSGHMTRVSQGSHPGIVRANTVLAQNVQFSLKTAGLFVPFSKHWL